MAANPETAAFWFKAAADKGHSMAMIYLGVLYLDGRGVKGDAAEAVRLFRARPIRGTISDSIGSDASMPRASGWRRTPARRHAGIASVRIAGIRGRRTISLPCT